MGSLANELRHSVRRLGKASLIEKAIEMFEGDATDSSRRGGDWDQPRGG
jgi:hypothetical protein